MALAPGAMSVFAGSDHIDDTPVGLPFEVSLGLASQVQARTDTRAVEAGRRGPHAWSVEVALTNAGVEPAMVELRQPRADGIQVTSEDGPHRLDRRLVKWRIPVAPHASSQFRYTYAER